MKAKILLEELAKHPDFSELQIGTFEWDNWEDIDGQFFPKDTPIQVRRNFTKGKYLYSYNIEISKNEPDNSVTSEWECVYLYRIED